MDANDRKPRYRAYLLRCWETHGGSQGGGVDWRFSLADPHTGRQRYFAGLDLLIEALRSDLQRGPEGDAGLPNGETEPT